MKSIKFNLFIFWICSFALSAQTYQKYSFRPMPFGGGGCVSGFLSCPTQKNLIIARTDVGGLYRWVEATKSWKSLQYASPNGGNYCVESMAIDPSSPNRFYCVTGEVYLDGGATTLMRSVDYGETWEYINVTSYFKALGNSGGNKGSGERLRVDPNKGNILYYGSRTTGLWKSTNYGSTWSRVSSFPVVTTTDKNGICFIDILKDSGTPGEETPVILAAVSRGDMVAPLDSANIYLSKDKGVTWTPISGQAGSGSVFPDAKYTPSRMAYAKGKIYITYGNAPRACMWRYDVNTNVWEDVSPNSIYKIHGVSIDNADNPTVIAASTNSVFAYLKWGSTTYGDDIFRGTIDQNGKVTWGPRMIDSGTAVYDPKWFIQNVQLHWAWGIEIDKFNKNRVFVTSGNGIYSTDNFTASPSVWYANVKGLEETAVMDATSIPNGKFMLALGDISGAVYSDPTKYGYRFVPAQTVTTSVDYAPLTTEKMMIRSGSKVAAGGISSNVMYSTDGGIKWTGVPIASLSLTPALPNPLGATDKGLALGWSAVSADGKIIAWATNWQVSGTTYYNAFYTADKGVTWNAFPAGRSTRIYADKVNPNVFYSTLWATRYTFTWDGSAFQMTTNTNPANFNYNLSINPLVEGEYLAVSTSNKLFLMANKGATATQLTGLTYCISTCWGKPAPGRSNCTIFAFGKIGSETVNRIYRSDDMGTTWVRVTTDGEKFGGNSSVMVGDMNTYGRVFFSTYLGMMYGEMDNSSYAKSITVSGANGINTVAIDGDKLQMNAQFNPANTTNQKVFWEVDNPALATIDSTGLLTAKKAGNVQVLAWALDGTGIFGIGNIKVTLPMSIGNTKSKTVSVYPNPFKNHTKIVSENALLYRVISQSGVVVESGTVTGNAEIGMKLLTGAYILEIKEKETGITQKIKLLKSSL